MASLTYVSKPSLQFIILLVIYYCNLSNSPSSLYTRYIATDSASFICIVTWLFPCSTNYLWMLWADSSCRIHIPPAVRPYFPSLVSLQSCNLVVSSVWQICLYIHVVRVYLPTSKQTEAPILIQATNFVLYWGILIYDLVFHGVMMHWKIWYNASVKFY